MGRTPTSSCSTPARCARTPTTSCTEISATLAPRKQADPDMQIAVGGCLAQKDRDAVLRRAPWVDVVFGTHNIGSLPTLLDRARHNRGRPGGDRRGPRGVSVRPARGARVRLCRMGVGIRRLQQHLHVLHRARVARQGGRPAARRRARRGHLPRRSGCAGGDAARPERQRLRGLLRHGRALARGPDDMGRTVRATVAHSPSCCGRAVASTDWNACASPHRTLPSSPTT